MKKTLRIDFSPLFNKQRKSAPLAIKQAFRDALDLFSEDPTHSALRNHPLSDEYAGFSSIDVTEDWRALFRQEKDRIIFAYLGTHDELYGS
jgi:addiction module RelE/StbE family toxin